MHTSTAPRYAIIGAGPSGLAGARTFQKHGLDFDGFEAASEVGGLWNIDNPRSTMYESAHLISSRTTTEFTEFPMPDGTPDYPGHKALQQYFVGFSREFDLARHFRFDTEVTGIDRVDGGWRVTWKDKAGTGSAMYTGVVLANGTLATPSVPSFPGTFTGELLHSSQYKSADVFRGKRVLIIGAGNSGCDIAVDAVHHAASIDMSVRRGYYFVPRYLLGRPADTLNPSRMLPARVKQWIDSRFLKLFTGDPVKFGFPEPDYRIYESHPIVNTLVLGHLGQGDLRIRPDIDRFEGTTVYFTDGTSDDYDLVMLATGYELDYGFIDKSHLNWTGMAPTLFLNIFGSDIGSTTFNGVYVLGMVEAIGLGWQGRYEQAELLARYLAAEQATRHGFEELAAKRWPDLTGGYHYLGIERMSYYVNKDVYRHVLKKLTRTLKE
ncbi:MAG TPA: NAD(P)-binding domain-containing protein [Terrimesophilobacter sp.]|nr:NAD(P)-binding domain-containing protein [Terrimesophilobacter sp.]